MIMTHNLQKRCNGEKMINRVNALHLVNAIEHSASLISSLASPLDDQGLAFMPPVLAS